ncbi:hypothetical protein [Hymenobacter cellulosilyticus]|uniref:Uncharacterized protein n=1 Tax=Hymenobacter cellulosilyticus TaxID=2932248 RepID=A0A8T9Q934_9BACT|nr:hypothetical protein [Hymenobacter cellulosilyticus]UOQ74024.1 hypothetical protein MUN79_09085 [Hymenobacter cellulosilyticus]
MGIHPESKHPKKSIRLKYNRKKIHLINALEQFILMAEQLLDENKNGRTYKRRESEHLLEESKKLLNLFPNKDRQTKEITDDDHDNFIKMLDEAYKNTQRMKIDLEESADQYERMMEELKIERDKLNKKNNPNK